MSTKYEKALYFKNFYRLYEETDMTIKQVRTELYNDADRQKRLGISLTMVDNFWEALMDGAYEPQRINIKIQSYELF